MRVCGVMRMRRVAGCLRLTPLANVMVNLSVWGRAEGRRLLSPVACDACRVMCDMMRVKCDTRDVAGNMWRLA